MKVPKHQSRKLQVAMRGKTPAFSEHMETLSKISVGMLNLARAHMWARVEAMNDERCRLLDRLHAAPLSLGKAGDYAGELRRILEINREILALGENERRRIAPYASGNSRMGDHQQRCAL